MRTDSMPPMIRNCSVSLSPPQQYADPFHFPANSRYQRFEHPFPVPDGRALKATQVSKMTIYFFRVAIFGRNAFHCCDDSAVIAF